MQPFDVLIPAVPDPDLGPLLTKLNTEGFEAVVTPASTATAAATVKGSASPTREGAAFPQDWHVIFEPDEPQSYRWPQPEKREVYTRYRVFAGTLADGSRVICRRCKAAAKPVMKR